MRRVRLIAVLGLAGALATGCGQSGAAPTAAAPAAPVTAVQEGAARTAATTATTTTETTGTTEAPALRPVAAQDAAPQAASPAAAPQQAPALGQLSPEQAEKLATAGVLLERDLPGYQARKVVRTAADQVADQAMAKCLGTAEPEYLYRNYGTEFASGDASITSSSDVVDPSAPDVAQDGAAGMDKLPGCLKEDLGRRLQGSGLSVSDLALTPVTATVAGADHTFAMHLAAALVGPGGGRMTLAGDMIFVAVGPTRITLVGIGPDGATSLAQITDLAGILTGRVHSAEAKNSTAA